MPFWAVLGMKKARGKRKVELAVPVTPVITQSSMSKLYRC